MVHMLLTIIYSHNQKSMIEVMDTEGQELEKKIADAARELEEMKDDVSSVLYVVLNTVTHSAAAEC